MPDNKINPELISANMPSQEDNDLSTTCHLPSLFPLHYYGIQLSKSGTENYKTEALYVVWGGGWQGDINETRIVNDYC